MLEGFDAARHTERIALILSLYRSDKDFGYAFVMKRWRSRMRGGYKRGELLIMPKSFFLLARESRNGKGGHPSGRK